jgi:4-azaleucine resistance transporter AzlC
MYPGYLSFREGVKDGFPICVGYFPTAMAFGLVCRKDGLRLWEAALFSLTNFAGSGQFLAESLLVGGTMLTELVISVALVNLRYLFMGAAIKARLEETGNLRKFFIAFGTTDEVFSVSTMKESTLNGRYMAGLQIISYLGWCSGTIVGFIIGSFLPVALQLAVGVTLYAMFSSLLAGAYLREGAWMLCIAAISAVMNSLLVVLADIGKGWAFVISMLTATGIGALRPSRVQEES